MKKLYDTIIEYFELGRRLGYRGYTKKETYNIIIEELKIKNTIPELIKSFEKKKR